MNQFEKTQPLLTTICAQGFEHSLWKLNAEESASVLELLEGLDSLYIADGHHRMAAVSEYLLNTGKSSSQGVMSLIMDRDDLLFKSFHRLLKNVGEVDIEKHLQRLPVTYVTLNLKDAHKLSGNTVAILSKQGDFLVSLGACDAAANAVEKLEVNRIERMFFPPMFGIHDSAKDEKI